MSDYVATKTFAELPLSEELRRGIADKGYVSPTPVQAAVIDPILAGKDVICRSKTGTGKTAAFGIPLIERVPAGARKVQAIALCNTRELALQVSQEITALAKHKDVSIIAIYGGASMDEQRRALEGGAEIVVGTPGRVLDLIKRGTLKLDDVKVAVLDEADEMLGAGFFEEVTRILDYLPKSAQILLFSATVPPDIDQLAQKYLKTPETILLSGDVFTVDHIKNVIYYTVDAYPKPRNLLYLLEREDPEGAIIFCNLRTDTELIANVLNRHGLDAEMLNGDLPQKERERVMAKVKRGELKFMVATDIAARGIDISDLSHVINYSLPEDPAVYLHRVGRTGRIGKKGTAISLVSGAELVTLSALEKKYGINFETRKLPTPDEAKSLWTDRQIRELRDAMQGGMAFEAFLPLARDLAAKGEEGVMLTAYALRYFYVHHRMERAQARAAGVEKMQESRPPTQVAQVVNEQKAERKKGRGTERARKPRLEGETKPPPAPASDSGGAIETSQVSDTQLAEVKPDVRVDRVKLFVDQGTEAGWDNESLAQGLSALAGQPRDTVLAIDLKGRHAYVVIKPDAKDAYLAAHKKPLKDKEVSIEVARPRRR